MKTKLPRLLMRLRGLLRFARNDKWAFLLVAIFLIVPAISAADELDLGRTMLADGDLPAAAEFFNKFALENPKNSKKTPEALALCGRALDGSADALTGEAEKACYWTKGGAGSPECMSGFATKYNQRFGDGAFRYEHAITYLVYTGSHYLKILEQFPKSDYAPEAEFYLLLHQISGHPNIVLPKIKAFLAKYPKGEWNRKGLLLWARANEDIWYVHRKWSWVLYNYQLSPDELIIKAEPYRQEALSTYERLQKNKNTFEGKIAAREYEILKANREDERTYSIVNDAIPGTMMGWGLGTASIPAAGDGGAEVAPKEKGNTRTPTVPKRFK